jgi:DNA-binding GntR family transcriptional regulator
MSSPFRHGPVISLDDGAVPNAGHVATAHERLRTAILTGLLAPGSALSQQELSRMFDVGRTPLREAIRLLQEEGLVLSEPNRRVHVADFSIEDLEDLYSLRLIFEASALRVTIPALSPEQAAELGGLAAKMDHYGARRDFERFEVPHRAFHALLVSRAGARTRRLTEVLSDHAERYRRVYLSRPVAYEVSREDHMTMLQSALDGEVDECVRQMVAHYMRTATGVAKQLDPDHRLGRLDIARQMALAETRHPVHRNQGEADDV